MKKLNPNKLSVKEIEKIRYKAAFSQFVDSLKVWKKDCFTNCWKCCETVYISLALLHKHISCNHVDVVKKYYCSLKEQTVHSKSVNTSSYVFTSSNVEEITCICSIKNFVVILFYHYVKIECDLQLIKEWQERICRQFNLKGKVRIAFEGLNATLEGCRCEVDAYKATLTEVELFSKISLSDFKESSGDGNSFDTLSVAVCDELCTMGISPSKLSYQEGGQHLSPEQFHEALKLRKCMKENGDKKNLPVLLDVRNFYESKIGYFDDALCPDLRKFSYFPEYVDKNLDIFEGREVLTYCTGGIRCERATAYIKKATNCSNVYQLHGGIHKYLEKYPDGFYKGRLFVFDNRYSIGSSKSEITSACFYCSNPHNEYKLCASPSCYQLVLICCSCREKDIAHCCRVCKSNSETDVHSEQCECTAKRIRASKERIFACAK